MKLNQIKKENDIKKEKKEKKEEMNMNINYESSDKMIVNENNIIENKTIYNLDEQLNNIIDKEKKNSNDLDNSLYKQ